jgi:MOSC domain-containing protein YiiM
VIEAARTIEVRAVSVGMPSLLHVRRDGEKVISGIRKFNLPAGMIDVGPTNIVGDGQQDLVNHGGPDKAVYAYPTEHLPEWKREIGYQDPESPFGENLSLAGVTEDQACIGDIWAWGPVRMQISQPRWPCSKLALRTGHMDMIKRLVESGRSGWYLRVLTAGRVDSRERIQVELRDSAALSVREAFAAGVNRSTLDDVTRSRVADHPALSEAWRHMVRAGEVVRGAGQ